MSTKPPQGRIEIRDRGPTQFDVVWIADDGTTSGELEAGYVADCLDWIVRQRRSVEQLQGGQVIVTQHRLTA